MIKNIDKLNTICRERERERVLIKQWKEEITI